MKWILRLFILSVFASVLTAGAAWYLVTKDSVLNKQKQIVATGGARIVAQTLYQEGIIRSPELFYWYSRLSGKYARYRAGEYVFSANITLQQTAEMLINGKMVQRKVTLVEGTTVKDFLPLLNGADGLTGEEVKHAPEGSLLADTYFYTWGETRHALLGRMQQAMKDEMAAIWKQKSPDLPITTKGQAVTLASIIEKETADKSEYAKVAQVYTRRLKIGMLLQADPTVIYGITGGHGKMPAPLTFADLKKPTLYNTYVVSGLPPTPIANVGRGALRAALSPASGDYLYFVANGKGGHTFARTLREHNRNVAVWRRLNRKP